MNCCGQKRYQWQQSTLTNKEPVPANADPVLEDPVQLQYNGTNTILVKGTRTGYLYIFAGGEPALAIDGRDVQDILSLSGEFSLTEKVPHRRTS
jgi:hypothetical protein